MGPIIWGMGCSFVVSILMGKEFWQSGHRKGGVTLFIVALIIALSIPTVIGIKIWEVVSNMVYFFYWILSNAPWG